METTKKKKKGKWVVQEKQAETSDIDLEMILGTQPRKVEEKKEEPKKEEVKTEDVFDILADPAPKPDPNPELGGEGIIKKETEKNRLVVVKEKEDESMPKRGKNKKKKGWKGQEDGTGNRNLGFM